MSGASQAAIQHHYDRNNEFYGLWLDSGMTYSAALFAPGDTLEEAQTRKLDYHIGQSRAAGKDRVLDVGCGWGSTLKRLVGHHGVAYAVGLTLSQQQAAHITETTHDARIDVRLEAWKDHKPTKPYDSIISIGAFEHFARPDLSDQEQIAAYREFFKTCHSWLEPQGVLSLQTIAYGTARRKDINAFILEHIFPESDLPTLSSIVSAFDGLFELEVLRNDRLHYAETFRHWGQRLYARKDEALALVGEETVKRYERYQGLFTLGFHTGAMDLLRLTLKKIG